VGDGCDMVYRDADAVEQARAQLTLSLHLHTHESRVSIGQERKEAAADQRWVRQTARGGTSSQGFTGVRSISVFDLARSAHTRQAASGAEACAWVIAATL
jgi:hypothetical protein